MMRFHRPPSSDRSTAPSGASMGANVGVAMSPGASDAEPQSSDSRATKSSQKAQAVNESFSQKHFNVGTPTRQHQRRTLSGRIHKTTGLEKEDGMLPSHVC
eukprot:5650822-Prymnesium_polylepis.2